MGLVMILTGLLGLVSDIATSLVTTVQHEGRCNFTTGIVVSDQASSVNPSPYGAAALYTQAAQLTTVWNFDINHRYGLQGIYKGFNPLATGFFFATEDDIIGYWECNNSSQVLLFERQSNNAIAETLVSEGYIYQGYQSDSLTGDGPDTQLVVLSASSTGLGYPWDVKIAVDMKDDQGGSSKSVQVRTCTLRVRDLSVNNIRNNINITEAISQWGAFFQANLYQGFNSDHPDNNDGNDPVGHVLEVLLNSMIMVAGTQNSINIDSDNLEYGCLYPGSQISYGIAALVLLVFSMDLFFMFYWLYLKIKLAHVKREYDKSDVGRVTDSSVLCESVPNSILDWVVHAAHESNNSANQLKHHHLRDWLMSSHSHNGRRVGLVQKHGNRYSPPTGFVAAPNFAPTTNTFLTQKTGYDVVQTSEIWLPIP
jgi:hypothetical protein